jgi:uncharacterized protein YjfI (DUF2170 family)
VCYMDLNSISKIVKFKVYGELIIECYWNKIYLIIETLRMEIEKIKNDDL